MGFSEQHKAALVSCIEITLMRSGNTNFNLIVAKLNALYDCQIRDCYDHPEYLQTVLKEVYKDDDYKSIIHEIKTCLDDLVNEKDISDFFKIMEK
ncbi:MAG: hypothetical protein ABI340_06810 [Nitrososphaera sp.]